MLNSSMVAPSRCRLRGIRACFTPRRSSGTTGRSVAAGSVFTGPMLTKISALKDFFLGSQLQAELGTRSAEPANHYYEAGCQLRALKNRACVLSSSRGSNGEGADLFG